MDKKCHLNKKIRHLILGIQLNVFCVLKAVIQKFPEEVLVKKDRASAFFLPLVARLVCDPSPKCRALVGRALKALLSVRHPFISLSYKKGCCMTATGPVLSKALLSVCDPILSPFFSARVPHHSVCI